MSDTPPPPADRDATRAFYDRISRVYDLLADAAEHDARAAGLRLLGVRAGERVVEVGFGTGHALVQLARSVGERGSVAGVDFSPGMAGIARDRLVGAGLLDRVDLRCEAIPPLPYADGSFDAAFLSFTLELFPDGAIPFVLSELRRVLRADGRVAVVAMYAPPSDTRDSVLERAYRWMHRHFPHIVDCRPIDVEGVLRAAGFRITGRAGLEIWTLRVAAVVAIAPPAATSTAE
jgi:demethylmenaquinone methyltransferase/2-methoxy-6-polyprenyl-1,4-benzoquinol methylase